MITTSISARENFKVSAAIQVGPIQLPPPTPGVTYVISEEGNNMITTDSNDIDPTFIITTNSKE